MACTGISRESVHFHVKNTENTKFVYNPKGALGMKTNENGQENLFPFLFLFFFWCKRDQIREARIKNEIGFGEARIKNKIEIS